MTITNNGKSINFDGMIAALSKIHFEDSANILSKYKDVLLSVDKDIEMQFSDALKTLNLSRADTVKMPELQRYIESAFIREVERLIGSDDDFQKADEAFESHKVALEKSIG